MITELSRFTVKKGKEKKALEWMTFLNTHMSDTLLTLKGEKMYAENIFSEVRDDHMYLYWFTFQKEGGQNVEESTSWIDKKHLEYWDECLVMTPEDHGEDLNLQVSLVEPDLTDWINNR